MITTVAGSGDPNFAGDLGQATSASFKPRGLAVDNAGNLYIAAAYNQRVFRVTPGGAFTTLAGTGTPGFSGDNGPATAAQLGGPADVAVDGAGNVYIADRLNHRVRKVSPNGVITTIAGTGTAGSSGDNGPATAAELNQPSELALDGAGNLYIATSGPVRKVSPAGLITTILSGSGGALAADGAGNVYVSGEKGPTVVKVSPGGATTVVAGTGKLGFSGDNDKAIEAELSFPSGLAVDSAGNLYIADLGNHRVRKVSPDGVITTIAGTGIAGFSGDGGPAASARLDNPVDVAVDDAGNLYIADEVSNRVRKVAAAAPVTPATPTTPEAGGQTDAAVEAEVVAASAGRSRLGKRVVRLELSLQENVSATLALVRKGTTLATKQFATVREGERVLTLRVPAGAAKGRATLRFELSDQEGNTLSGRRGVRIGKP
jgi:sugar lactone lactonase YvrE